MELAKLLRRKGFQDEISWVYPIGGTADSDADSVKLCAPKAVHDRKDTPMPPCSTSRTNPNAPKCEVEIVVNNSQIVGCRAKVVKKTCDRFPAPIHVALRLCQESSLSFGPPFADQRITKLSFERNLVLPGNLIDNEES